MVPRREGAGDAQGLEAGLAEALPGLEIIDRDLRVGELTCDLVGLDAGGRLVLLSFVDDAGDDCVLAALDALACGRTHLALIARHLDQPRLRRDLDPLVVLVAEHFPPRAAERLAAVDEGRLRLLEMRELRSAQRVNSFFVPVGPNAPNAAFVAAEPEAFLDSLQGEAREAAGLLLERIALLDRELFSASSPDGLEWRFRGQMLCAVGAADGLLQGTFPRAAPRALHGRDEVEAFLEGAVARYVELLDQPVRDRGRLQDFEMMPAEGATAPVGSLDSGSHDFDPDEDPPGLGALDAGPLLTREELEAFREPLPGDG